MTTYVLYLGLNDKKTKQQKIDTIEAYKITQNIILSYTGGATIYNAKGIYTHKDGSVIIENTLRIELAYTDIDTVKAIAMDLKKAFNQESVLLDQIESNTTEI